APAGDGVQPRLPEPLQNLLQRPLAHVDDVLNLRGRESVKVDGRIALLEGAQEVLVPLQGERGMMSSLEQDPGAPHGQRLVDLLEEQLPRVQVPFGRVAGKPVKGAKRALRNAK